MFISITFFFWLLKESIIYFKVQHEVVFLWNTHSILYLKTWLCAFQFFKINSGIQMLHTSSTNSTENAYGLIWMFLHSFTILQVDLHFCNLLLHQDSLILKKYSVFFSTKSSYIFKIRSWRIILWNYKKTKPGSLIKLSHARTSESTQIISLAVMSDSCSYR